MATKTRLEQLEEQMREILSEHDRTVAVLKAEDERQARAEADKAKAMERLPDLRKREAELWAMHDAAIDALDEAITGIVGLHSELGKAYGRPRRTVHNRIKLAVKAELQRRRLWARAIQGRDWEAMRKARAKQLRETAKELEKERRRMVGGGGSVDQARDRIAELNQAADRIEGKPPVSEDDAMFIPPELALGRLSFGKLKERISGG